jgi:beta-1,4-N-acetylglucosaminyltransferase
VIFVTVGTTDFDALVAKMDQLAPSLGEPVIAQIGRGAYLPHNIEHFRFAPSLTPYYERADIVVAHGGLGTLIEVMQRGIKLIGLSNPDRYDRHQDDLLRTFEAAGHMIWCRTLEGLPKALAEATERSFRPYVSPVCGIAQVIRGYLGLPDQEASLESQHRSA